MSHRLIIVLLLIACSLAMRDAIAGDSLQQFQNWLKPKPKVNVLAPVPQVCPMPELLVPLTRIPSEPRVTHTEPVPVPVPKPKQVVKSKTVVKQYRSPTVRECGLMRDGISWIGRQGVITEAARRGFSTEATETALKSCNL